MRNFLGLFLAGVIAASGCARAQDASRAGILILADSNGEGPFGGLLYETLRAMRDPLGGQPLSVSIFAKCGAGANDWIEREYSSIDCGAWSCAGEQSAYNCAHFKGGNIPVLRRLYDDLHGERRVTLVALGLNMIIGSRAQKLRDAARLIAAIADQHSACIWIGPPQPGDLFVDPPVYENFVADLKRTVERNGCRYIASDDKTDRRNLGRHSKDDHYSKDDAEAWARKVLTELNHPANRDDKPLTAMLSELLAAAP